MKENTVPFWAQPTSKLEFHSTEEQKIKEETMKEYLGLGKKGYGTKTDTEWFQLPIGKAGFRSTLGVRACEVNNCYVKLRKFKKLRSKLSWMDKVVIFCDNRFCE